MKYGFEERLTTDEKSDETFIGFLLNTRYENYLHLRHSQ